MSGSSRHVLGTRLFVQAAVTCLLAPLMSHGSVWLAATVAVGLGAAAVALLLQKAAVPARQLVLPFEVVAVAVGVLGILGGHYIPGTIIGVATLVEVLRQSGAPSAASAGPAEAAQPAPPVEGGFAPVVPPMPQVDGFVAPVDGFAVVSPMPQVPPMTENPYAPAPAAFVPPQAAAPVAAAPAPATPAPLPPAPVAAPEPPRPLRPEDVPPAQRTLTILPGK